MPFEAELQAAITAAEEAGRLILAEYELFEPIPDAPVSISTHVDRASQELILACLQRDFPEDGFCAEENTPGRSAEATSRMWVIDPIDGTRGFAKKNGEFSVMIAFTFERQPVVGVVLEPATGQVTYASISTGCWTRKGTETPTRCVVSRTERISDARLVQSHAKPGAPDPVVATLRPAQVRETYSAGLKLALVARGESDLYVNSYPRFFDWDICAGHILVTEAGGEVTDLQGKPIIYAGQDYRQSGGLLASNGKVHAESLPLLPRL